MSYVRLMQGKVLDTALCAFNASMCLTVAFLSKVHASIWKRETFTLDNSVFEISMIGFLLYFLTKMPIGSRCFWPLLQSLVTTKLVPSLIWIRYCSSERDAGTPPPSHQPASFLIKGGEASLKHVLKELQDYNL